MNADLSDLVDSPRETLEIELKQWVDLNDLSVRADIARHIAALSNHGGGYLVFGICDDGTIDPNRPPYLAAYNHDTFNSIVKKYLSPAFHCDVPLVASSAHGGEFPVVRVPSHGNVPICAKKDGPRIGKGSPRGIRSGLYYIRLPGPESRAIESPQDWSALIRRCTINDRDMLLREITQLLHGRGEGRSGPSEDEKLSSWHASVWSRFQDILNAAPNFSWPVPLEENCYQLSYLISHEDEAIPLGELRRVLEEVNNEVRNTVWTGWSMFYPFSRPDIAPQVFPESKDGTGGDVLETNLVGPIDSRTGMPDFWRVSPDGRASLIRGYREDARLSEPGNWLSPMTALRESAELVVHALAFSQSFPSTSSVAFRCTWKGLSGRQFRDFDPAAYWSPGRVAAANERTMSREYAAARLTADWTTIVADLACPVLSIFGFADCSPGLVEQIAPQFRVL